MAATIMQYPVHAVQDALLSGNVALPNAANTVNTNVIDLQTPNSGPFPTSGRFTVQLTTTQSTGANSKNINIALQHSSDNSSWANVPELAVTTIAGNAANFPATTVNVSLPPTAKRYIRGTATGEANGGNASDGTLTVKLLF